MEPTVISQEPFQSNAPTTQKQGFPQIAEPTNAHHCIVDSKIFQAETFRYFLPTHRHRDRSPWPWPDRVDGGQGSPPCVLVVIHQNVPGRAFLDAILYGDQTRIAGCQRMRERLAEGPYFFLFGSANDGHVNVKTARSSGLHEAGNLQALKGLMNMKSSFFSEMHQRIFHGSTIPGGDQFE